MNYEEAMNFIQNTSKFGSVLGLDNIKELLERLGNPQDQLKVVHIAGTNGKGSCSHTLAAILQRAGYRTGLYTSPHLVDFRERIRVNGEPVPESYVVDFVEKHRHFFEPLHPSFFELTTAMAFRYFADSQVDVAVIEVGLGGRLDCTNIIRPDLCVITNISFDHIQFLGDTLEKIAAEKAGIIKSDIPVVVGETTAETKPVFLRKAQEVGAPIIFAEEEHLLLSHTRTSDGQYLYQTVDYADLKGELGGLCQLKNTNTLLSAIRQLKVRGYALTDEAVREGFAGVCELTGLMGRWQKVGSCPTVICDTGHNVGGISYIVEQLALQTYDRLHIVMGMVNDKDISGVLAMLPRKASYYFTQASVQRALPAGRVKELANKFGLEGEAYPDVSSALAAAKAAATDKDLIFVGGSSFIVADLLSSMK